MYRIMDYNFKCEIEYLSNIKEIIMYEYRVIIVT